MAPGSALGSMQGELGRLEVDGRMFGSSSMQAVASNAAVVFDRVGDLALNGSMDQSAGTVGLYRNTSAIRLADPPCHYEHVSFVMARHSSMEIECSGNLSDAAGTRVDLSHNSSLRLGRTTATRVGAISLTGHSKVGVGDESLVTFSSIDVSASTVEIGPYVVVRPEWNDSALVVADDGKVSMGRSSSLAAGSLVVRESSTVHAEDSCVMRVLESSTIEDDSTARFGERTKLSFGELLLNDRSTLTVADQGLMEVVDLFDMQDGVALVLGNGSRAVVRSALQWAHGSVVGPGTLQVMDALTLKESSSDLPQHQLRADLTQDQDCDHGLIDACHGARKVLASSTSTDWVCSDRASLTFNMPDCEARELRTVALDLGLDAAGLRDGMHANGSVVSVHFTMMFGGGGDAW